MTTDVRETAKGYRALRTSLEQSKNGVRVTTEALPQFELHVHPKLALRAAQHFLETQLLTGRGELLTLEEVERLDDAWVTSVLQLVTAIRFEADG